MRLGAVLPIEFETTPPSPSVVADGARKLVDNGFESIWTFDCLGARGAGARPFDLAQRCRQRH